MEIKSDNINIKEVKHLTSKGQVLLPKLFRDYLGIKEDVEVTLTNEFIMIKPPTKEKQKEEK